MRPTHPPTAFATPSTVPEAILDLEGFLAWCESSASRLGFFAALYLQITKAVKEPPFSRARSSRTTGQMSQLDVTFANRYLKALNGYFHPDQYPGLSRCWLAAFVGAESPGDTVVQHMLSGVAAHIGLDLGIATQQVCGSPENLLQFQGDYDQINTVLAQRVQARALRD